MQSQIQYTERIELGETFPKPTKPETQLEPRSTHIQAGGEWQQIEEGADSYPSLETAACN